MDASWPSSGRRRDLARHRRRERPGLGVQRPYRGAVARPRVPARSQQLPDTAAPELPVQHAEAQAEAAGVLTKPPYTVTKLYVDGIPDLTVGDFLVTVGKRGMG